MGLRDVSADQKIRDTDANATLTPAQMQLNKLGALFLFTARGATMIHEGQEFARSKVVANDPGAPDPRALTIDANSYNKDNGTNHLNFAHARANRELVDYYRGLIALRKKFAAFRRAAYDQVTFLETGDTPFALGYEVRTDSRRFLVLMNADPQRPARFDAMPGTWTILVDGQKAGTRSLGSARMPLTVPPRTGFVLMSTGDN
jgi:pullulanase/glycogen debranching enzyme